mgnify:CR=1 FL=1
MAFLTGKGSPLSTAYPMAGGVICNRPASSLSGVPSSLTAGKALQEILPIMIVDEDFSTLNNAPDHDVVQHTGCVQAALSRHGAY